MARAVTAQTRTPADELRSLLDQSEKLAVSMAGATPAQARQLLAALDRIVILFPELEAAGVDLQPERGRWEGVQGAVRRHRRSLLATLKPAGGLAVARAQQPAPPPAANWWWQTDRTLAAETRRKALTWAAAIGALVLVLVLAYWLFNRLFPVDPIVAEVYRLRNEAQQALLEGDLASALADHEAAAALSPDDPETLAWLAALYDASGRGADADAAQARLRPLRPDFEVDSLLASAYLGVQLPDKAKTYVDQALAANPEYVIALITAADISQARGQIQEAIAYLERADEAAGAQNLFQEQAVIRIRLAQLLQQPLLPTPAE